MGTLEEALQDPIVLESLKRKQNFKFQDAPKLLASVVHWPPHVTIVEKTPLGRSLEKGEMAETGENLSVTGPMGNVLHTLANAFNFTYTLVRPGDGSWGAILPNGTWSGMVGQVYRKEVDIALGPFGQTASRTKVVDFTNSFYFDDRSIIVRKGLPEIDPWGFLLPLSPMVWAGFAGALVLAWVAMMVIDYQSHPTPKWAGNLLFYNVRILLYQDIRNSLLLNGKQRLLTASWVIVVLLVTWSYTGNLISLLAVRYIPQPIQTLRQLIDSGNNVIMEPNTIVTSTLATAKSGDLADLHNLKHVDRVKYHHAITFPGMLDTLVRQGDHVVISTTLSSSLFLADLFAKTGNCDFYRASQTFVTSTHCMIGQKGSPLVPLMSQKITQLIESGLYNYWLVSKISFADACRSSPSTITVKEPLKLSNVWGIFAILASGISLASFVFLLENLLRQ